MSEESKIAIVSHGAVVEFNPNSAEHRKILESANRKLITNELYQRDLKRFKELVLFYQSAVSKETIDDKIEEFLRATGIRLDYSDLAIFNCGRPDVDGCFRTLYNRAMSIKTPSAPVDENPIVGLKESELRTEQPVGRIKRYSELRRAVYTGIRKGFLERKNACVTGAVKIDSLLMVTDSDGKVRFRKPDELLLGDKIMSFARRSPRPNKQEGVKANPNIRYWYDKFGVGHEIPPNKPMEAGSVKRNEGLVIVSQPSNNGGPIPSPDPRDESVRSKDTVIQNSISISAGKVNINALKAACRTMAESMKVMHRKTISKECYDKLINELEFIFAEFRNVKEGLARIYLYGKLLRDETFKQKYGVVFSADEWNAFLNSKLSSVELAEKYVKVEEKKTLTRKEFDECLNALKAIMQLVGPNGVSRKDAESAEPLRDLLNTRFGLKITRRDFLNQIYRRQSASAFLKHYAHVENN